MVQMFCVDTSVPAGGGGPACALRTDERQCTEVARLPATRPERRRSWVAIEAAARLILQRRRKGAAMCLAFCPLDQHGRPQ
jgi:hypothetical protein